MGLLAQIPSLIYRVILHIYLEIIFLAQQHLLGLTGPYGLLELVSVVEVIICMLKFFNYQLN